MQNRVSVITPRHSASSARVLFSATAHGFSLVELAVVLVILGLLTGGILVGRSLIRASEIQSVTADYNRYMTAISAFRGKYLALPGDMTNATSFWGADPGGCPATSNTVAKTATCNGNGDRNLATFVAPYNDFTELYRAWQHLANAGMIEGTFTGVTGPNNFQDSVIGVNVPPGRIAQSGWSFYPLGEAHIPNPTIYWNNNYATVLFFGTKYSVFTMGAPALSGLEAFRIDSKIDDGKPGYGSVSTYIDAGMGFTCLTNSVQSTADYVTTDDTIRCSLIFKAV